MVSDKPIISPRQVFQCFSSLKGARQQHCGLLCLNARNYPISQEVVSIETLNASLQYPGDVFYPAMVHKAVSIIVVHNHPSGDTSPSADDLDLTVGLVAAGKLLGIAVSDHIIVAAGGYTSLREQGYLEGWATSYPKAAKTPVLEPSSAQYDENKGEGRTANTGFSAP